MYEFIMAQQKKHKLQKIFISINQVITQKKQYEVKKVLIIIIKRSYKTLFQAERRLE